MRRETEIGLERMGLTQTTRRSLVPQTNDKILLVHPFAPLSETSEIRQLLPVHRTNHILRLLLLRTGPWNPLALITAARSYNSSSPQRQSPAHSPPQRGYDRQPVPPISLARSRISLRLSSPDELPDFGPGPLRPERLSEANNDFFRDLLDLGANLIILGLFQTDYLMSMSKTIGYLRRARQRRINRTPRPWDFPAMVKAAKATILLRKVCLTFLLALSPTSILNPTLTQMTSLMSTMPDSQRLKSPSYGILLPV